jgi:hypothetical protein
VNIATGMVRGFRIAWEILKPVLMVVWGAFGLLLDIVNVVLAAFGLMTGQATEGESAFTAVGKTIGFVTTAFIALKAAGMALAALKLVFAGITAAVGAFGTAAGGASLAMLGPAGLVLGVGAGAAAIGHAADEWLHLSDRIAGVNKNLYMTEKELNKIGQTKKRGAPKFLSLEEHAKKACVSTEEYATKRATKIAGEQTAKDLGLSAEVIKQRLLAGEDVYQELAGPKKPATEAADGAVAAADGEANKAKAAAKRQEDAMEKAFAAAQGRGVPIKVVVPVKIGDEEIGRASQKGLATGGAMDFQATSLPLGEF